MGCWVAVAGLRVCASRGAHQRKRHPSFPFLFSTRHHRRNSDKVRTYEFEFKVPALCLYISLAVAPIPVVV